MVKKTSVIASPFVLITYKMFVLFMSYGEAGGVDNKQGRKSPPSICYHLFYGSEASQLYYSESLGVAHGGT